MVPGENKVWMMDVNGYQFMYDLSSGALLKTMPQLITEQQIRLSTQVTVNGRNALFMITTNQIYVFDQQTSTMISKNSHALTLSPTLAQIISLPLHNKVAIKSNTRVAFFDLITQSLSPYEFVAGAVSLYWMAVRPD
jgi:hypothetical protein